MPKWPAKALRNSKWCWCEPEFSNNNNNNNNNHVQTDRTIPNNQADIIIRDNEKRTCMLIDVVIPGDRNVIKKEAENILQYKDLTIEIQRMWNVKSKGDTSNNWSDWDHFQIIQKIRERHTGKP